MLCDDGDLGITVMTMTVGDDDDDKREGSLQEGTVPFLCVKLDNHVDFLSFYAPPLFPLILT